MQLKMFERYTFVRVRFDWGHQRNGSRNIGFSVFPDFRKMQIWGIFTWDLEPGKVCNGLEMAVGFKWTDSQLISSHLTPFPTIVMILFILLSIPMV